MTPSGEKALNHKSKAASSDVLLESTRAISMASFIVSYLRERRRPNPFKHLVTCPTSQEERVFRSRESGIIHPFHTRGCLPIVAFSTCRCVTDTAERMMFMERFWRPSSNRLARKFTNCAAVVEKGSRLLERH